jgi:hypothetical protein
MSFHLQEGKIRMLIQSELRKRLSCGQRKVARRVSLGGRRVDELAEIGVSVRVLHHDELVTGSLLRSRKPVVEGLSVADLEIVSVRGSYWTKVGWVGLEYVGASGVIHTVAESAMIGQGAISSSCSQIRPSSAWPIQWTSSKMIHLTRSDQLLALLGANSMICRICGTVTKIWQPVGLLIR